MRLARISFTNYRCFRDETIEFGDYTSFVGPNNCGKSTVLRALNTFFGSGSSGHKIDGTDFYVGAPQVAELSIKIEFDQVDGEAAEELSHYVRNGRLTFEIIAQRGENGILSSRCRGVRFGLAHLAGFFAAIKAGDRKPIYDALREQHPDELEAWKNMSQAEEQIRAFETAREAEHVPIPSEENAYGATGPIPILRKYLEWIYVPAVKDASSEAGEQRNSAFTKLIIYAVRSKCDFSEQIQKIRDQATENLISVLDEAEGILAEVGGELDKEFKNLTTTPIDVAIKWDDVEGISVTEPRIISSFKDGKVIGAPEVFGHGLQRTYLMALLSLAGKAQDVKSEFKLLLGIEEPELYQHPPQARFLATALADLATKNAQVMLTTHSPHFISGRTFESVRVLRKNENRTKVFSWTVDEQRQYYAKRKGVDPIGSGAALSGIDKSLQTNIAEMFFAGKIILVEGHEDVALIESYLRRVDKLGDFLRAGCHLVPVGGKPKMPMLVALARGFSIDTFCIFDMDMNLGSSEQANGDIIKFASEVGDIIPENAVNEFAGNYYFGWFKNIQAAIEQDIGSWQAEKTDIADGWGWSVNRMEKDPMLLSEAIARTMDKYGDIPSLKRLTEKLEAFWKG